MSAAIDIHPHSGATTTRAVGAPGASPEPESALAAWLAGEVSGEPPACTCRVIAGLHRYWNGVLSDGHLDSAIAQRLVRLVGSRDVGLAGRRALLAYDWLVRESLAGWMRLAGLEEQAKSLEDMPTPATQHALIRWLPVIAAAGAHAEAELEALAANGRLADPLGAEWEAEEILAQSAAWAAEGAGTEISQAHIQAAIKASYAAIRLALSRSIRARPGLARAADRFRSGAIELTDRLLALAEEPVVRASH